MRPYDEPEIQALPRTEQLRRRQFNKKLSKARISIEHTFGLLKGRLPGIAEMGDIRNVKNIHRYVHAAIVLHNICIDHGDHPEESLQNGTILEHSRVFDDVTSSEAKSYAQGPGNVSEAALRRAGLQKRDKYLARIVPT